MRAPDGTEHHLVGVYRLVEPPKKLVYTWRWESEPDAPETLVTVEFLDRGGATDLVLTHELFPNEESKGKHEHRWAGCLDKLARAVASSARTGRRIHDRVGAVPGRIGARAPQHEERPQGL